jgi:outer membrane lipase/esterase
MRHNIFALSLITAAVLAGCGSGSGSSGGDQTLKTKFTSQVTFGDSLTDVGTYKVGTVAAVGGGKYTINGDATTKNPALTGKNWTELIAAQLGLPAPCAAMTGLDGDAALGFSVPVQNHSGCFGYGQGGARVTNPVGPGNKLTGSSIGQLTVPVVTQVANHLAVSGGKFSGTEVVFVVAGGNDILELLGELQAAATAAGTAAGAQAGAIAGVQSLIATLAPLLGSGATDPAAATGAIAAAMGAEAQRPGATSTTIVGVGVATAAAQPGNIAVAQQAVYGPMVVKAQTVATAAGTAAGQAAGAKAGADYAAAHGPALVAEMAKAGAELAAIVKNQIVGKGANYVVVGNLPDFGSTPASKSNDAATQALINAMVSNFNTQLSGGIGADPKVLLIDLYSVSHDQITNPGPYGLTNTSTPACGANPLADSSLGCNATNLIAGDVSHYMFADTIHPTPFEGSLIAKIIAEKMIIKGWL